MTGIALDPGSAPAATPAPTAASVAGQATSGQPNAIAPAPAAAPGSVGSPVATPTAALPWHSTFADNGLRDLAGKKNWATPEDAVKSYSELEKAFSAKTTASTPPPTAADYKFDAPAGLPEGMAYNTEFANSYRGMAHKAGLSNEQATAMHGAYVEFAKQAHIQSQQAASAALTEKLGKAATTLEADWGAKTGTPAFTRQLEMAQRAIRMLDPGMRDALKANGTIVATADGKEMIGDSTMFRILSKVGAGMYAEDALYGRPVDSVNPFDAKTEDMNAQGWLIKNDPAKAEMLIRASGDRMSKMYSGFLERRKSGGR